MKSKDVPQDPGLYGEHHRACYAQDEDGNFVVVRSKGWDVELVVNRQANEEILSQIEAVRQEVIAGTASPLKFHMVRCQMTPALLGANAGIWRWRVSRHLTPAGFAGLDARLLQRYAEALAMKPEDLSVIPEKPLI